MYVSASAVPKLNKTNWMSWSSRMTTWLRQLGLWGIINESWEQPKLDLIVATKNTDGKVIALTAEQQLVNAKIKLDHGASLERYLLAKEKAAGDIYAHLSPSQRALVRSYKEDPATMWGKLLEIHSQQVPGMRFGTTPSSPSSSSWTSRSRLWLVVLLKPLLAFKSCARSLSPLPCWTTSLPSWPCSALPLTSTTASLCLRSCGRSVNCRHSGGCGKRQETMHSVVYTPGGRGKRQETMLCSVTTPKLIY
jgi:hypothetical protein